MQYKEFYRLVMDATEFDAKEAYIAEVGGSVPADVPDDRLGALLEACWAYAHDRSVKTIRGIVGMSRAEFAREYRIPLRTVENWEATDGAGARRAPGYVADLLAWAVISDAILTDAPA